MSIFTDYPAPVIDEGQGIRVGTGQQGLPRTAGPPPMTISGPGTSNITGGATDTIVAGQPNWGIPATTTAATTPAAAATTTTTPITLPPGDAGAWMQLVQNPTQLGAWFKQQNPALSDAEVQYFVQQAQASPGANPTEQAGGGDYWSGRAKQGNQGGQGTVGSLAPFYGGAPFNPAPAFAGLPADFTTDPSYQWRLNQGRDILENNRATQGLLRTGGTLKELTDYGQGAASQEYGAAFNRGLALNQNAYNQGLSTNQNQFNQGLQTNQNLYNQNYGLANLGLNSTIAGINGANGVASQGANFANTASSYANAAGNNITGIGNANANATIGTQNAYNPLFGTIASLTNPYYYR